MGCLSSTQLFFGGAVAGTPSPAVGIRLKSIVPVLGVCCSADSLQRSFNEVSVFAFSRRSHCRTVVVAGSDRGEGERTSEDLPLDGSWNDATEKKEVAVKSTRRPERDFAGTPNVPVYVMLPVVMSFHECGGNVGDDVYIPLPSWVSEIGKKNPDIYFTDRKGHYNPECLTWGIDKERVLRGRTAVEVYFDFMRSFRVEFDEFFASDVLSEIEVGLGPCGELRFPSYPERHGWRYPGIGEFQCYDQYLLKSLRKAAEARGHTSWARGPDNAGSYNSRPHDTGFFRDGGDYDSYYGRFFLKWYSQVLVEHGDRVLSLAKLAFEGTCIAVKISGIHWWYKTASHAAELTGGFYNPCNRDGYAPIAAMLKKHDAALNFTCVELRTLVQNEEYPEALVDPEGLVWQDLRMRKITGGGVEINGVYHLTPAMVLNAAWDECIPVASENALPCYDRDGYNKILENAKPLNDPDKRHLSAFTYLRLSPDLMERQNLSEFEHFVKRMHGEVVAELHPEAEGKI